VVRRLRPRALALDHGRACPQILPGTEPVAAGSGTAAWEQAPSAAEHANATASKLRAWMACGPGGRTPPRASIATCARCSIAWMPPSMPPL
jgi:hypothetical protein